MNIAQTVIVNRIGQTISGVIRTTWDEEGAWWEDGILRHGLIGRSSTKYMEWDSVIHAHNFADEIGASFVNEVGNDAKTSKGAKLGCSVG